MKKLRNFKRKLFSPTPKKYRRMRNFAGGIAAALTAGVVAVNTASIALQESWQKYIGIGIFIFSAIAAWAQSHEEKKEAK